MSNERPEFVRDTSGILRGGLGNEPARGRGPFDDIAGPTKLPAYPENNKPASASTPVAVDGIEALLNFLEGSGQEALDKLDERIARQEETLGKLKMLRKILAPGRATEKRSSGCRASQKIDGLTPLQYKIAKYVGSGRAVHINTVAREIGEKVQAVRICISRSTSCGLRMERNLVSFVGKLEDA